MSVVHIDTIDFSASMGGEHLHAYLKCDGESIQLTHELTEAEAARLNKKDNEWGRGDISTYKPGEESVRFETEEKVKERAKEVWKEHFPKAKFLIFGGMGIGEVVDGDPNVVPELNALYKKWDDLYYSPPYSAFIDCTDDEQASQIENEFDKIIRGR